MNINFGEYDEKVKLPPMPHRIAMLPRDELGRPIPWFVAGITPEGKVDFRFTDTKKIIFAVRSNLCWVCGEPNGKNLSFLLGPMCVMNRNNAEPPGHRDCMVFSAQACPFLTKPNMRRRENDMPERIPDAPGIMIKRNPGVVCVWTTRNYEIHQDNGGLLFTPGDPVDYQWFCEGRAATRLEVTESLDSGLPLLAKAAEVDKEPGAMEALKQMRLDVEKYFPGGVENHGACNDQPCK